MAFEGLTEKLSAAFKRLRGKGRLTEADVKDAMREIRLALLEADVSYKVVKDFTKSVTERAIGADVMESLLLSKHSQTDSHYCHDARQGSSRHELCDSTRAVDVAQADDPVGDTGAEDGDEDHANCLPHLHHS